MFSSSRYKSKHYAHKRGVLIKRLGYRVFVETRTGLLERRTDAVTIDQWQWDFGQKRVLKEAFIGYNGGWPAKPAKRERVKVLIKSVKGPLITNIRPPKRYSRDIVVVGELNNAYSYNIK